MSFRSANTTVITNEILATTPGGGITAASLLSCPVGFTTNTLNSVNFTDAVICEAHLHNSTGKHIRTGNLRTGLLTGVNNLTTDTVLVDSVLNCARTLTLGTVPVDAAAIDVLCRNGSNNVVRQSARNVLNGSRIPSFTVGGNLVMSSTGAPTNVLYHYEKSSVDVNHQALSLLTFNHTVAAATNSLIITVPNTIDAPYHNVCQDILVFINTAGESCFLFWNGGLTMAIVRKDGSNFPVNSNIRFGLDELVVGVQSNASFQLIYYNIGMSYI